ncbi:MAG: deoxyribose-phosphate aldolase [Proteobacteria bacterium]|nr:MAG: deoxyribose-phosphate aldolase [Pseudomonadota bacterium]
MTSGPVVVASDHGGFTLKESIKRHLTRRGVQVLDVGTHDEGACDYPVFARAAAEAVASGRAWRGVVIDGAGIGSAMVGNKIPGVRAGMAFNVATAINAAEHNGANLLTLGAGYVDQAQAAEIVDTYLSRACTVDRHRRRVAMIDALDDGRAPASAPAPRSSAPMAQSGDFQQLVDRITAVLTAQPALLAGLAPAPSPGASSAPRGAAPVGTCADCTACGHCVAKRPEVVRSMTAIGPEVRVSSSLGVRGVPRDLAKLIDHTLLRADATYDDIDTLCDEAREYGFASVCVNPVHVRRCAQRLRGAEPLVCTVIGFPLGATPKEVKALEARRALRDGARELDMVINIGALKSGDHKTVLEDIRLLAEVAHEGRAILKVIIETALLTDEDKRVACELSRKARADFVKTSTGMSKGGATAEDVALMARAVDYKLGVKASGGVRSAADAARMVEAGATRIGASVGVKIAREQRGDSVSPAAAGGGY